MHMQRRQTYVTKTWSLLNVELDAVEQESCQRLRRVTARKRHVRLQVTFADHEQNLSTDPH